MVTYHSLMGIIQPRCTKCCLFIAFLRRSNSIRSIWCLQLVISTKIDQDIKHFRFTSNLYSGDRNRDAKFSLSPRIQFRCILGGFDRLCSRIASVFLQRHHYPLPSLSSKNAGQTRPGTTSILMIPIVFGVFC